MRSGTCGAALRNLSFSAYPTVRAAAARSCSSSFPLSSPGVSRRHPTTRRRARATPEPAPHPRRRAALRPSPRRVPGGPLARDTPHATWRRRRLRSCLSISHPHHKSPSETPAARAAGNIAQAPHDAHDPTAHARSPTDPKFHVRVTGREAQRRERKERRTTHTPKPSRRAAYIARLSRNPRRARLLRLRSTRHLVDVHVVGRHL